MEIKFNSVEEVLEFADRFRLPARTIEHEEVARSIARIAEGAGREKIPAIKLYRAVTGEGLRESKAAIERYHPFSG